jgi:hypothetical protein
VDLITVTGRLDNVGLTLLRRQLVGLCADGEGFVVADLSGVHECDHRLFHLLSQAHRILTGRGGWLRLAGVGAAVLNALDQAPVGEVLMVYRASDWGEHVHRAG